MVVLQRDDVELETANAVSPAMYLDPDVEDEDSFHDCKKRTTENQLFSSSCRLWKDTGTPRTVLL